MNPVVSKINQTQFLDPKGNIAVGYAVTFMVGTQGPFTITIPQAEFTAVEVNKRTQAFAAELAQIPMEA